VRITDISVSRFHTLIKLNKKGEVIIQGRDIVVFMFKITNPSLEH